ncbi:hypothetical protein ACFLYY_02115 [Patescibacteria group bacterium]
MKEKIKKYWWIIIVVLIIGGAFYWFQWSILNFLNINSRAITAMSAIIIALLAIYGIREWRRQIKGKTNYEIARRYLKASLNLRNTISYVREPFVSLSEMETALKEHGLKGEKADNFKINNMAVYSRRWKEVQKAWSELEVEIIDAEVSWGSEAVNASNDLISLVKELFIALQIYIDGQQGGIKDELIYNQGSLDKPDKFSRKIEKSINKIKEFLKPHLL